MPSTCSVDCDVGGAGAVVGCAACFGTNSPAEALSVLRTRTSRSLRPHALIVPHIKAPCCEIQVGEMCFTRSLG